MCGGRRTRSIISTASCGFGTRVLAAPELPPGDPRGLAGPLDAAPAASRSVRMNTGMGT